MFKSWPSLGNAAGVSRAERVWRDDFALVSFSTFTIIIEEAPTVRPEDSGKDHEEQFGVNPDPDASDSMQ